VPKADFPVAADSGEGLRLDVFLAGRVDLLTRSQVRKFIDAGAALVDGEVRRSSYKLRAGETVSFAYELAGPSRVEAQDIPLVILHEDADIIVIDKPAGLVVHPGAGNLEGTLANALLHRYPEIGAVGPPERPGIVHRLDKDTSGVIVVARSPRAYESLLGQFKRHEVEKTYLALVNGRVSAPEGRMRWPIGRHPSDGKRISVRSRHPRDAETLFRVLRLFRDSTLLEVRPLTGRTHQIRVHLAAAGHAVLGDQLYGTKKRARRYPRLCLHAARLAFLHPGTGERVEFSAPAPPDLEAVVRAEERRNQGG
jgi:23S rRNA pseudouridine1911/1915/1917 synthase